MHEVVVVAATFAVLFLLSSAIAAREELIARNGSRDFDKEHETLAKRIVFWNSFAFWLIFLTGVGLASVLDISYRNGPWLFPIFAVPWHLGSKQVRMWLLLEQKLARRSISQN